MAWMLRPQRILLTAGASAGLVAAFTSLFRTGDTVALCNPGYPAYRNTLRALGMEPLEIACGADRDFKFAPDLLDSLEQPPAGLVLASPANPTGAMLDSRALSAVTTCCRDRGIHLISDEIYHGITFGEAAVSALESDQELIVINSFSKLYRMPGWRLGWMVAPEEWVETISANLINMFLTPPTLAQHAALAAMGEPQDLLREVASYRENRDILVRGLKTLGIDQVEPPAGAFYVYADMSQFTGDSLHFCIRAVDEIGLALAPGIDFDPVNGKGFVRFSFAIATSQIQEALRLLGEWLPSYRDHANG